MNVRKYFAWGAIIFIAAAVVGAFFIIGSPARQRQLRFDERRVRDLQEIQYQITRYYEIKGELPESLESLRGFESFRVPMDPETGAQYTYQAQAPLEFRLCADFALPATEEGRFDSAPYERSPVREAVYGEQIWLHPAGRGCFDVTLEPPVSDGTRNIFPAATVRPAS